jgi:hypothetical protein
MSLFEEELGGIKGDAANRQLVLLRVALDREGPQPWS